MVKEQWFLDAIKEAPDYLYVSTKSLSDSRADDQCLSRAHAGSRI